MSKWNKKGIAFVLAAAMAFCPAAAVGNGIVYAEENDVSGGNAESADMDVSGSDAVTSEENVTEEGAKIPLKDVSGSNALTAVRAGEQKDSGITYYVDAINGNDTSDGLSETTAWKTIEKVNSVEAFLPGDLILFKKGQIFEGVLEPQGSGEEGRNITLGAYGTGERPVIKAKSGKDVEDPADADVHVIMLKNQHHWTIRDLEVEGGRQYGIRVTADGNSPEAVLSGFSITNCEVHDVWTGEEYTGNRDGVFIYRCSGLINFYLWDVAPGVQFSDIVITDNYVHDTDQFNGIGVWGEGNEETRTENVRIEGNTSHYTGGVGIHHANTRNVVVRNNLVSEASWQAGTGIEVWNTDGALWEYNESFDAKPKGYYTGTDNDNGAFDIDYYCKNIVLQYNYGHGCAGYGLSVFGADDGTLNADKVTSNITARYNIFSNNNLWASESTAKPANQGAIFLSTWSGGSLNGIQIYNNTIYHNPVIEDSPAFNENGASISYSGAAESFFKNNIIYATNDFMWRTTGRVAIDNNLYYSTTGSYKFEDFMMQWGVDTYSSLEDAQNAGHDAHSKIADPMLTDPDYSGEGMDAAAEAFTPSEHSPAVNAGADVGSAAEVDFAGNSSIQAGIYDIGAIETSAAGGGAAEGTELESGYWRIKNQETGEYLDNAGNGTDGAALLTAAENGTSTQEWYLVEAVDGTYHIINRGTNSSMQGAVTPKEGLGITQWAGSNLERHRWNMEKLEDGTWQITVSDTPDLAVESQGSGKGLKMASKDPSKGSQIWIVERVKKDAADKSRLQAAVDHSIDESRKEEYTEESWKVYFKVLEEAKKLLNDKDAAQEAVDEAEEALKAAIDGLVKMQIKPEPSVDKSRLRNEVNNAVSPDEKNLYTEESWAVYSNALEAARALMNSDTADQESVDKALADLKNAREALKAAEKDPVSSGDNGQGSDQDNNQGNGSQNEQENNNGNSQENGDSGQVMKKAPQTGDNTPIGFAVFVLAVSVGMAAVVSRKRLK